MLLWELRKLSENKFFKSTFVAVVVIAVIFSYYFSDTESVALTHDDASQYINGAIKKAEANYASVLINSPDNEYAKNYQTTAAAVYKNVADGLNVDEDAKGWDVFFMCDTSILTLLLITFTIPLIFSNENSTGMIPVMRTAKCGRRQTSRAKTEAAVIVSILAMLTIEFVKFMVVCVKHGYSSLAFSVQSFADLVFVPYSVSIAGYLGLHLLCGTVSVVAYGLILNELTAVFYNGLLSSAFGIVFYLLNLLFKMSFDIDKSSVLRAGNFVNISSVPYVLSDYGYIRIGGGIMYLYLVIIVCVTVSLVFFVLPIIFSSAKPVKLSFGLFRGLLKRIEEIKKDRKDSVPRHYPRTVFGWEMYKLIISRCGLLMLLGMILFGSFILSEEYKYDASGAIVYYKTYMENLEGEYTDEKYETVILKYEELEKIISEFASYEAAYQRGELTFMEFDDIQVQHYSAQKELELLTPVYERAEHLKALHEKGITGDFFFDTGIVRVFSQGFDPVLYITAVICFSSLFSSEYVNKTSSGTMASIIKATKKGRNKTYFGKYAVSIIWITVMSLVIFSLEMFYIYSVYPISGLSSPLISIVEYGSVSPGVTVFSHLIKVFGVRMLGGMLVSVLLNALSEITASSVKAVVYGILLTGLVSLSSILFNTPSAAAVGYFHTFGGEGSVTMLVIYTIIIFAFFGVSYLHYKKT